MILHILCFYSYSPFSMPFSSLAHTTYFFKSKEKNLINWKKIIHPVLIVTIIAILIKLGNAQNAIPEFVIRIFTLLGGMTIPLIMIILGGNIYVDFQKKGQIQILEITKFVIIKNILFPLIFLGLLIIIKPAPAYPIALIILLESAVPPVTAVPLVTERVGGNRGIVNQFIVASFASSLASIPVMIYLFSMFFMIP